MRRLLPLAILLVVASPRPVQAQESLLRACAMVPLSGSQDWGAAVESQFRFLCGQVVATMATVQPSVGIGFSGGAHTLGTATTIGRRFGIPRISATARINAALVDAPDLLDGYRPEFTSDGQLAPMGTVRLPVFAVQGDVTLGILNGISVGPVVSGVGALDLLGSVSLVPAIDAIGLDDAIVNVGVGARLGIIRQGLILPGVSVSGMYRTTLGDVAYGELGPEPGTGDPAEFSADLSTWSFRAGASKGFLVLDLAAGLGWDIYSSDVHADWLLRCPPAQCGDEVILGTEGGLNGRLRTSAWNAFGNVGVNLALLRLVAEVGYQRPTDVVDAAALQEAGLPGRPPTTEALDGGRFFLGLGLRATF